jgi:hypothetical protein
MTDVSKFSLSDGYQPRVKGGDGEGLGDGAPVGDVEGDGIPVGGWVGVGADVGEPACDGLAVGAGPDAVTAGPAPLGGPLYVPASAVPPATTEATTRTAPALIAAHFSIRMCSLIPANDSP